MKIALIEDSPQLSYQLRTVLQEQKYIVRPFREGNVAVKHILEGEFDMCIIDVNLPDTTGFEVATKIRKHLPDMLIIFLTVRDSVMDKIKGFESGADDYLTKPFDMSELLARVKALGKRQRALTPETVNMGKFNLDKDGLKIFTDLREILLSSTEFQILEYLIKHKGIVVSKERLTELIWDNTQDISPNIVPVYVAKIRKKIADLTGHSYIKTVKFRGYVFNY